MHQPRRRHILGLRTKGQSAQAVPILPMQQRPEAVLQRARVRVRRLHDPPQSCGLLRVRCDESPFVQPGQQVLPDGPSVDAGGRLVRFRGVPVLVVLSERRRIQGNRPRVIKAALMAGFRLLVAGRLQACDHAAVPLGRLQPCPHGVHPRPQLPRVIHAAAEHAIRPLDGRHGLHQRRLPFRRVRLQGFRLLAQRRRLLQRRRHVALRGRGLSGMFRRANRLVVLIPQRPRTDAARRQQHRRRQTYRQPPCPTLRRRLGPRRLCPRLRRRLRQLRRPQPLLHPRQIPRHRRRHRPGVGRTIRRLRRQTPLRQTHQFR